MVYLHTLYRNCYTTQSKVNVALDRVDNWGDYQLLYIIYPYKILWVRQIKNCYSNINRFYIYVKFLENICWIHKIQPSLVFGEK